MQVGDLVRNIYTDEVYVVTETVYDDPVQDYIVTSSKYLIPKEHLEVISESR